MKILKYKKPIVFLLISLLFFSSLIQTSSVYAMNEEALRSDGISDKSASSEILAIDISKTYRPNIYINVMDYGYTIISGDKPDDKDSIPGDIITSAPGVIDRVIITGDCRKNTEFDSEKGITIMSPSFYPESLFTLELNDVTLDGNISTRSGPKTLNIELTGTNSIKPVDGSNNPGIGLSGGNVVINGDGILNVWGTDSTSKASPAIGSKYSSLNFGKLTIESGTINAKAYGGAAIGSAMNNNPYAGYQGTITINGGKINATSEKGAAIGGGYNAYHMPGFIMNDGEINAYSSETAILGTTAPKSTSTSKTQSFKGGTINAYSYFGPAIGDSRKKNILGDISFEGTTIYAKSEKSHGISSGNYGINIYSGFVTADGAVNDGNNDFYCKNNVLGGINIRGGSIYGKNNSFSFTPEYEEENVFKVIVPELRYGESLKGNKAISSEFTNAANSKAYYKAKTVSLGSENEHGSILPSTIGAIIYLPAGSHKNIKIGEYSDGMAKVVEGIPGINENIVVFPEINPQHVEYKTPTLNIDSGTIKYGTRLNNQMLNDDGAVTKDGISISGTWELLNENSMPKPETTGTAVVFTPGNENIWTIHDFIDLDVSKGNLTAVELPDIEDIYYGQTLSHAGIHGGTVVFEPISKTDPIEGQWKFKHEKARPPIGTTTTALQFVPTGEDKEYYNIYETDVEVTVKKGVEIIREAPHLDRWLMPKLTPSVPEQYLTSASLTGGSVLLIDGQEAEGEWEFLDKLSVSYEEPGIYKKAVKFNFSDNNTNYSPVVTYASITVFDAETTVTELPTVDSDLVYGQSLGAINLNGGIASTVTEGNVGSDNNVDGKFYWADEEIIPTFTGIYEGNVKFVPDNKFQTGQVPDPNVPSSSTGYLESTAKVKININKAGTIVEETPYVGPIFQGENLGVSPIEDGKVINTVTGQEVSGKWMWENPRENLENKANYHNNYTVTATAVFIPEETNKFEKLTEDLPVKIMPFNRQEGTLKISEPAISDISYGRNITSGAVTDGKVIYGKNIELTDGDNEFIYIEVPGKWHVNPVYSLKLFDVGIHGIGLTYIVDKNKAPGLKNISVVTTVNVVPAELTEYEIPEITDLKYGDKLSDARLSGGGVRFTPESSLANTMDVTGNWQFQNPSTVVTSNTTDCTMLFIPTGVNAGNYLQIITKASIAVQKAKPDIVSIPEAEHGILVSPAGVTQLAYLSSAAIIGGDVRYNNRVVSGKWTWEAPDTTWTWPDVYTAAAIFTPDDKDRYDFVTTYVAVTVKDVLTTVKTAPTAPAMYVGVSLGAIGQPQNGIATTVGDSPVTVTGSFIWAAPQLIPPQAGTWAAIAIFKPDNIFNKENPDGGFVPTATMVSITVRKASISTIGELTGTSIYFGQPISKSILSDTKVKSDITGEIVDGSWNWEENSENTITSGSIGFNTFTAVFTPDREDLYNSITKEVEVEVIKHDNQSPVLKYILPENVSSPYGNFVSDNILSGGSVMISVNVTKDGDEKKWQFEVGGKWEFENKTAIPDAPVTTMAVKFTPNPTGAAYVETINEQIEVNITPSQPTEYIPPEAGPIYYGEALTDSAITQSSVTFSTEDGSEQRVDGTWAFDDYFLKPDVGSYMNYMTFTPTGDKRLNFLPITTKVSITVLDGKLNVDELPVPDKLMPEQTTPVAAQFLTSSSLTGGKVSLLGESVSGDWKWNEQGSVAFEDPGTYTATAVFVPHDNDNLLPVTTDISITVVDPVTYVSEFPVPSPLIVNQTLGAVEIPEASKASTTTENNIGGHFVWEHVNFTPTKSGIYTASAMFIPDIEFDPVATTPSAGYFPCSTEVAINVEKGSLTVERSPNANLSYGQIYPEALISDDYIVKDNIAGSRINGKWRLKDTNKISGKPGSYRDEAIFTPELSESYNSITTKVDIVVSAAVSGQGGYSNENPKASDIEYGQKLKESIITGKVTFQGKNVAGNWTFEDDPEKELNAGDHNLDVLFTPTGSDAEFYSSIKANVKLHVNKVGSDDDGGFILNFLGNLLEFVLDIDMADIFKCTKQIVEIYNLFKKGTFSKDDAIKLALKSLNNLTAIIRLSLEKYNSNYGYYYGAGYPSVHPKKIYYGTSIKDDMVGGPNVYLNRSLTDWLHGKWEFCEYSPVSPKYPTVLHTTVLVQFDPINSNYGNIIECVDINVSPAPLNIYSSYVLPEITDPKPGEKLSDQVLTGGSLRFEGEDLKKDLVGTWRFAEPNKIMEPGTNKVDIIFEPDGTDTFNYENLETTMTVNAPKVTGTISQAPQADRSIISKKEIDSPRQHLTSAGIVGTVKFGNKVIEGSWNWIIDGNTKTVFEESGKIYTSPALFVPDNLELYNKITTFASFTVYDLVTEITEPPAAKDIYYGQNLSPSAVLDGGVAVSDNLNITGSFIWVNPDTVPSNTGIMAYPVKFIPENMFDLEDEQNDGYAPSLTMIDVEVLKATTKAIEAPSASSISLGQKLEYSILTGGSVKSEVNGQDVKGEWVISHGGITPNKTGIITAEAVFTPHKSDLFQNTTTQVSVTVTPAEPGKGDYEYSAPSYDEITFGAILDNEELTQGIVSFGSITVSGVWTLENHGKMPSVTQMASEAGLSMQMVIFTPDEPSDGGTSPYGEIKDFITIKVNKAKLSKDTNEDGFYDIGGGGNGQEYIYQAPEAKIFSYGDNLNNNLLSGGAVTFGSVSVSGIWEFADPICDPDVNTTCASVKFTAADNWPYNLEEIVTTIPVKVTEAELSQYTLPEIGEINYKDSIGDVVITGGSVVFSRPAGTLEVQGEWAFDNPKSIPDAGTTYTSITFTPTGEEKNNYRPITTIGAVKINKAVGTKLTEPKAIHGLLTEQESAGKLQYLTSTALIGGVVSYRGERVSGNWNWENTDTPVTYKNPGIYTQSAIFTPDDSHNYSTMSAVVDVTVYNIITTINEAPTGKAIYYGQTLSKAGKPQGGQASAGQVDSVTGSFIWVNPTLVTEHSGDWNVLVKFQPEDTFNPAYPELEGYMPCFTNTAITVSPAPVTIVDKPEATSIAFGEKISQSVISGGAVKSQITGKNVEGTWRWDEINLTGCALGDMNASATFIPEENNNYEPVSTELNIYVGQAEPGKGGYEYDYPKASSITFGALLSDDMLTGGAVSFGGISVEGKWRFKDDQSIPYVTTNTGITNEDVVFIPDKASDIKVSPYGRISHSIPVTINMAQMSIDTDNDEVFDSGGGGNGQVYSCVSKPAVQSFTYGNKLSNEMIGESTVIFGESYIPGQWKFADEGKIIDASQSTAQAIFYPNNPLSYNLATLPAVLNLDIKQADLTQYVVPEIGSINYMDTLEEVTLTGGAVTSTAVEPNTSVSGIWSFDNSEIAPDAGTTVAALRFTPTGEDAVNYISFTTNVSVTVNKGKGSIQEKPEAAKYLLTTQSPPIPEQYLTCSSITKGAISYRGTTVPGIWTWAKTSPVSYAIPGVYTQSAIFTPGDTNNFSTISTDIAINVLNYITKVDVNPTAPSIMYGQTLGAIGQPNGGNAYAGQVGKVPGKFIWANSEATASAVGTWQVETVFMPDDLFNPNNPLGGGYATCSAVITVNVIKAGVTVKEDPSPSDVFYEDVLNDSKFTGGNVISDATGETIAGTWSWANGSQPVGAAGTNTFTAIFTPTQPNLYETVSKVFGVKVNKAIGTVTTKVVASNALRVASGSAVKEQYLTHASVLGGTVTYNNKPVNGNWKWANDETPVSFSAMGVYTQSAVFMPDNQNYEKLYEDVDVYVYSTLTYVDERPKVKNITYGQALSDGGNPYGGKAVTDTGQVITGSYIWVNPTFKPMEAGSNVAVVKFVPEDSVDLSNFDAGGYLPGFTTVSVIVNPVAPIIKAKPVASPVKYGDSLSASVLNGGEALGIHVEDGERIDGIFTWANPGEIQTISGNVSKTVIFTPYASAKYKSTEFAVNVNVGEMPPPEKKVANVTKVHTPNKKVYIKKGKSLTIPAKAYATDSSNPKLIWSSSKSKVASVSKSGKVKAKKTGTAKITIKAENGKKITVTVKVVKKTKKLKKFTVKGYKKTIKKGQAKYLTVKLNPSSATNVKVTFKSSKKSVLSVDKAGKITAKKKGTAKITVKAGGKKKILKIKVK